MLLVAPAVQAQSLQAQLNTDRIYLGTATVLDVVVSGRAAAGAPEFGSVEGLSIGAPSTSVTRDLFRGTILSRYRYRVTPLRTGTFTIPAIEITIDGSTHRRGPFTLTVVEAELAFVEIRAEPEQVAVGEEAKVLVTYQGVWPDAAIQAPQIDGLTLTVVGRPRIELDAATGRPLSIYELRARATRVGTFQFDGISLHGVPADPVSIRVQTFVVLGSRVQENALVVGAETTVALLIRGLPYSTDLAMITPPQIRAQVDRRRYRGPPRVTVFPFVVTALEPGEAVIRSIRLPDQSTHTLSEPIVLSIRQAGEGGIFVCRGQPRKDETVVGEPFIIDFEVLYRGELRGGAVDTSEAAFAEKDYIKVEPVADLSYPDWSGRPIAMRFGDERLIALSGTGDIDGRKEQMIRFALKVTPLATGELSLEGLRVVLAVQITEERRTGFSTFYSSRTQQYVREAEAPLHRVIDPPGVTRPALYRGAVGRMEFAAALDRTTATAMSPMTLTLRLSGEGVSSALEPPPLTEVPELTRDFDVSPIVDAGTLTGDTIEFTQSIRPRREDVTELPALPLVYYDYQARRYETVYSLPIPIGVLPGHRVGAAAMQMVDAPEPSAYDRFDASTAAASDPTMGLSANYATLGRVITARPLDWPTIAGILAAGPILVLLAWGGRTAWLRRRPAMETQRRARAILTEIEGLGDTPDVAAALSHAVQEYLRLRLSLPPGELSPTAAASALESKGCDPHLSREVSDCLARCDAGRFGVGDADVERNELLTTTRDLLTRVDRTIR